LVLVAIAGGTVPAQGVLGFKEWEQREVIPGAKLGHYNLRAGNRMSGIDTLALELAHPQLLVAVGVPVAGPLATERLEQLGNSLDATVVMGLDDSGEERGERTFLRGLRISGRDVFSWPGEGWHAIVRQEGQASFRELRGGDARLFRADGWERRIVSLNGPLPSAPGEVSLRTGAQPAGWYAGEGRYLVARMKPMLQLPLHQSFRTVSPDAAGWSVAGIETPDQVIAQDGEALLVLLADDAEAAELFRTEGGVVVGIQLTLPTGLEGAQHIFPVGVPVLRGGNSLNVELEDAPRNLLAVNATGGRLLIASAKSAALPIALEPAIEFLINEGYSEAVTLPLATPMLLGRVANRAVEIDNRNSVARLSMYLRSGRPLLSAADESIHGLQRLRSFVVNGAGGGTVENPLSALRDEKAGYDPTLRHFWMAIVGDDPLSFQVALPQPTAVGMIEMIHAEAAGFSPRFNLRGFRILGRRAKNEPLKELTAVRHESPVARDQLILPEAPVLSELVIEITEPNFFPQGDVVRLVEIYLWGKPDASDP
jgi:hypothetical protein